MIELVLFDLDGTLVDSSVDITNALNFAIGPFHFGKMTVETTIGMVGEGLTKLVEKVLGDRAAELKKDVLDRFISYYSGHLCDFTRPYPGILETLQELRIYKKAVISNKREILSRRLLEELGLASYFDAIFGSDSAGEKKPSPKPILKLLDMFSVGPGSAVMVGDSDYDVQAGKAAGVLTVAVSYGYRDANLLGSDFIIDDMRELPSVLKDLDRRSARQ